MRTLLSQWWISTIAIPAVLSGAIVLVGLRNGWIRRVDPRNSVAAPLPRVANGTAPKPSEARRALQDVAEAQSTVSAAVARPTMGFWAFSAAYLGTFTALHAFSTTWAAWLTIVFGLILFPVAVVLLQRAIADTGVRPRHLKGIKGVLVPLAFGGGVAFLWLVGYLIVTATGSRMWWLADGILVGACYLTAGIAFAKHQLCATIPTEPGAQQPHRPAHT